MYTLHMILQMLNTSTSNSCAIFNRFYLPEVVLFVEIIERNVLHIPLMIVSIDDKCRKYVTYIWILHFECYLFYVYIKLIVCLDE